MAVKVVQEQTGGGGIGARGFEAWNTYSFCCEDCGLFCEVTEKTTRTIKVGE